MSALHAALLAAAAAVGIDCLGGGHHPGGNQSRNCPAEGLLADGAPLGDPFDLCSAVLRRHLGRAQQQPEVAYDLAPRAERDPGIATRPGSRFLGYTRLAGPP